VKSALGVDELDIFSAEGSRLVREKLGDLTFAAATDGNHGRGVAWSASRLGFNAVIYVHEKTSQARIRAIESNGAKVVVIEGTYDDAVRQVNDDAQKNGWQVISDTSWPGYEDIPRWVMQGYTAMFAETQEQLAAQGIIKPSHVLVQAGVGSLAAATLGFYSQLFGPGRPRSVVVEPDKAACLYRSAEIGDGQPYSFGGDLDTIMAGLACGDPNPQAWRVLWDTADAFVKCPDYVAAKGMRVYGVPLAGDPFVVSGESGAATLGALMFIMQRPECAPLRASLGLDSRSEVLLINSEGNTDPTYFRRVVWSGRHPVPEAYTTLEE
jgi:diaminopropionate ammonia-lyase